MSVEINPYADTRRLVDNPRRCGWADCRRDAYGDSFWCVKHLVEFAKELPPEAIADTFPLEVVMPNRNVVKRIAGSRYEIGQDDTRDDDRRVMLKCLIALVIIGAFVAWKVWTGR